MAALDAYAAEVARLAPGRTASLEDASDALDRFLRSGSAFAPPAPDVPERVALLLDDAAYDAAGVAATAAAFAEADLLRRGGPSWSWSPDDEWIERRRRRWLAEHHPERDPGLEGRIREVMEVDGLGRAEAIRVIEDMDARIAQLIGYGYGPEEAVTAFALAQSAGLDLNDAVSLAESTDVGLIEVLGTLAAGEALDMTFAEVRAFAAFREHFEIFDNATGGDTDHRVSVRDLTFVVEHPDEFTSAQVQAARAILDEPALRNRLDTAADNRDFLDTASFGSVEPGDGVVSVSDIDAFLTGAYLNNLLGDYATGIDTAAHGGDADGLFSEHDLEAWLAEPANAGVPVEVRDGVQMMLDGGLYDQGWWDRNRDALAMGAAVLAGGVVIVLTAGTATPLVVTMGAGFVAGGVAAGGTTMAINHLTGESLGDGVLGNSLNGGMIGLSVAGLPAALGNAATVTSGLTLRSAVAVAGATSEVTGIVGGGGVDLFLPHDWEADVHRVANATSLVTGAPELLLGGADFAVRRWGTADGSLPGDAAVPVRHADDEFGRFLDSYEFDHIANPGPLTGHPRNPAGNFYAGRYDVDVLAEPVVVYRAGAADGYPTGSWYIADPIDSVAQARIDLAVRPQWIDPRTGVLTGTSPVDSIYAVELPAGTTVYRGPVGSQGGATMGHPNVEQLFIEQTHRIGEVVGRIDIGQPIDLLPTSAAATTSVPAYVPSTLGRSYGGRVVVQPPPIRLQGLRGSVDQGHAINRIIERGVTPQTLLETLRTPAVVLEQPTAGGLRYLYLSESGAAVMDRSGQLVTAWTRSDFNAASERILLEATGGSS